MVSFAQGGQRLTLHDAARQMGISFEIEFTPVDRFAHLDHIKMHYLEWGDPDDQTVLMLHGNSQQGHSWDFVSLVMAHDYHVMALDQRGHGDTDWAPDGDYSIEAHQKDIDDFVKAQGLNQFILMGHSMGGRNSLIWASRNPGTLEGLVIVDTGPETQRRGRDRIRNFQELPDELDSFEEFADRVQAYTGRSREQVLGALQYSIRERPDGKWTWKYDKAMRGAGRRDESWTPEMLWECTHHSYQAARPEP